VIGGWLMAKASATASAALQAGTDREFYEGKIHSTRFYAEQVLPLAFGLARIVRDGGPSVVQTDAALI
jgi:hypothetical protein